jgi:DNA mismatch repair ATPase MutS
MELTNHNGVKGVFIPYEEFKKGKFFTEEKLLELQEKTLQQRKQIVQLEKELIR